MRLFTLLVLAAALVSLSACSGGGGMTASVPSSYSISGTVTALAGNGGGLQLQDNGGGTMLVNANGSFSFPTAVGSGDSYNVTVAVQPSLQQTCEVTHGSGTATANVTNVAVDCGHGEWTWMGWRLQRRRPDRGLRDARRRSCRQHPRCAISRGYVERRGGKFLAVWRSGPRFDGNAGRAERPVEVQRRRMDLGRRIECGRAEGDLRRSGDACRGEHSRSARHSAGVDRCGRKFLALWRGWLRLQWVPGRAERSVEIQRGAMGVDGRGKRDQSTRCVRDQGNACSGQRTRGAIRFGFLDRCGGKLLAVWRERLRRGGDIGRAERPLEIQRGAMDVDERLNRSEPVGDLRDAGRRGADQRARRASGFECLERFGRKFLVVWRRRVRHHGCRR